MALLIYALFGAYLKSDLFLVTKKGALFEYQVCHSCCSTVILVRYLLSFLSIGKVIVAKFYPFFRVFRVRGPFITSRTIVREVMMGPRTQNARKNGYNKAEMNFLLRNYNI